MGAFFEPEQINAMNRRACLLKMDLLISIHHKSGLLNGMCALKLNQCYCYPILGFYSRRAESGKKLTF